uniref:Uncharacterized protein n=1 Tax=Otolemur garnettii TaxID=30611 RepID=H0XSL3_OTOGA
VRRWIKNPMVGVDKHQSPSLKYTSSALVHLPPGEPDFEPSLCQTCLGDHAFQRGVLPQEKESCSWETQSVCEVSSFLLWVHGPRIVGLCFSYSHAPAKNLMHMYKITEEVTELWPVLACYAGFLY